MKPTSRLTLVLLVAIGAVVGGVLEAALASAGRPIILPPLTLGLALLAIGVTVVVLALPIRRFTQGKATQLIDAYFATRVLVLAKASALSGSLIAGLGLGVTFFILTRSIVPGVGSVALAVTTLVGACGLMIGGLIAERMCTLPPDDDDEDDETGRRAIRARS